MSFSDAFLDDLRSRVDLAALVGRRVALKKAGREHSGLCPFHNEKSPSFTVNEDKGFYHCFGCGAHGDALSFIMETEHLEFREAVERLAAEQGMSLPGETPEERAAEVRQAGLREALEAAATLWHEELLGPRGGVAREYLAGRGVSAESIERFRLGWAAGPLALPRDRFPEALLIEAGLLRRREDGTLGPLMRERLIFPITDRRGRVIAFGGRSMRPDAKVKYINSPAGPLFDKGATLYGLALARDGAAESGRAVVVEGYLDVIAASQAGVTEVVAPLGTAITAEHLSALWRLVRRVILCLDGDKAGRAAAERAIGTALPLLTPGRALRLATLPEDHDPDSLIRAEGVAAFRERLDVSAALSDVMWGIDELRFQPSDSPEQRGAFERSLLSRLSLIPDGLTRTALLGEYRRRLRWGWDGDGPRLTFRAKELLGPMVRWSWLVKEWQIHSSCAKAAEVRDWLETKGVSWPAVVGTLGGIGWAKVRRFNAKPSPSEPWSGPKVPLWEWASSGEVVVIIPVWEGVPSFSALLDLVAWNPRSGLLLRRTGAATIVGTDLRDEALGYEARGLPRPLRVTSDPLAWLRGCGGDTRSVLLVDWARAWEALGGLSMVVADDREAALRLEKALVPPAPQPADVGYVVGAE